MTEGEGTEMDSEPEGDEDEREMEPADWQVSVGPRNSPTPKGATSTRCNPRTFQRLVKHTA